MRVLIESAEDTVPSDILNLNKLLREQHERSVAVPFRTGLTNLPLLTGEPQAPTRHFRNTELADPDHALQEVALVKVYPMERWLIQAHAYSEEQAGKVGILGRLFSGEVRRVKGGVIHDAKRFSVVQTEQSRNVEIGVAVRLSAATSKLNANVELTLPNLAAEAQLNGVEARIGITVLGYTGPLGELLPAPRKLDVETCADYLQAFRKIQSVIFGEAGWRYVAPTVLSYDEDTTPVSGSPT